MPNDSASPARATTRAGADRLASLDAYRGFIMLAMITGGLGLASVAKQFPHSELWRTLRFHSDHAAWIGGGFWDMIQPAFMFMVGVSMPFSYGARAARGDSYRRMLGHAVWRSFVLVALGVFLTSNGGKLTNFIFPNVLCQIGLGYTFLFLLWNRKPIVQVLAAVVILAGTWLAFGIYPAPPADVDLAKHGLPPDWHLLTGLEAHWNKNLNAFAAFDRWFLNLFPREKPFEFNEGGYTTLNFVPSLATMILGLLVGELMRSSRGAGFKLFVLIAAGGSLLAAGYGLHEYGLCPAVKRIWTPSWALYSGGVVFLMLAGFYLVIDICRLKFLGWPFMVVGSNSIAAYCMSQLMKPWLRRTWQTHLGTDIFKLEFTLSDGTLLNVTPITESVAITFTIWLICVWMYRQKIFVRI
jgi:predicted acyltransferase